MKKTNIIQKSISWSLFSEIAAKFVTPVTNMILARILTPEDFGVLAVCNMLISFADIITDAGFGKYIVQHDFSDEKEQNNYANVAFWSNFFVSSVIFLLIVFNREWIARILGNGEYAFVISVASIQLLFTSISSIQIGLFRRKFDFRTLFIARLSVAITPLIISVPLAIITKSYWALIIGNLSGALINSIVLTILSSWKPKLFYSFVILKKMFSFSFWSLCEGLANWMIFWIDTFMVTNVYSEYYVGIYKNSSNMIISIMGMISASMSPVLLSVLSRVKDNPTKFKNTFLSIQKCMMYLVIPMGIGLFCYRKLATYILFGHQWQEAANIVGAWSLMMMCSVIFYSFPAELYKSKGIPRMLFIFQCAYLIFLVPVCAIGVKLGFWEFVYLRCACVLEQIILSLILLKKKFGFKVTELLKNLRNPIIASFGIVTPFIILQNMFNSYLGEFFSMILSCIGYLLMLVLFYKKDIMQSVVEMKKY